MKANRRKLYSIYVHSRGASRDGLLARIRALKLFPLTQEVGDEYLRAMDKASSGRPHNGVILESSPLPVPPITELKSASIEDESFSVTVDSQSAEDALVNGKQDLYSYKAAGWRHPLILYVDGVVSHSSCVHDISLTVPARRGQSWGYCPLSLLPWHRCHCYPYPPDRTVEPYCAQSFRRRC
jgi:21S rRNA (GM2251-2'-O)-methyltransferase